MLLRQMKYFLAAVYCKSFNEAAKQCFISQPSFSLQIKQLEKELGVKLINRNNCNFSLTPAGEKFYEPCKRIIGDVQNLLQNMQRLADTQQLPHYTIGCKTGYNVSQLLNVINTLNNNTQLYHLEIIYGDHEQLMSMLKNKEIDIVLSESRANDSIFANEIVEIASLYVCISKHTPLAEKPALEISDLLANTCVIVANKEYATAEQEYFTRLVGFQGNFFIAKDMPAALTKVSDSQSKAFMPITSNSDAPMYLQKFIQLIPLMHNKQEIEIEYKIYWSKESNKQLTAIAQHIISLLLDH